MKGIYSVMFIVGALVAATYSYPNPRPAPGFGYDNTDMVYVPYEERRALVDERGYDAPIDGPVPEAGVNFNPFAYTPLASFVQSMQAMMRKVQMQMGEVLSRLPPQDIDWGKLGNTTSHTKVVNGHRVTINETTYSNKDVGAGAVVHIRVVDVKPTESEEGDKVTSTFPPLSVDNESSNEIPEKREQTEDLSENLIYHTPQSESKMERRHSYEYENIHPDSLNEVDNSVEVFKPAQPYDLSGDTRVNNLIRDQVKKGGLIMIDPDAELIDVIDGEVRKTYYPSRSIYDQQRTQPIFT